MDKMLFALSLGFAGLIFFVAMLARALLAPRAPGWRLVPLSNRGASHIGTAVVLVGTQAHPTPLGSFPILTKERDNVSEKYNNAPMPWTLRLTWDGIAIHGSPVMNGYASHGCIGVPDDFAAKLFAAAKRGDKVIITRGKMIGIGDKVM